MNEDNPENQVMDCARTGAGVRDLFWDQHCLFTSWVRKNKSPGLSVLFPCEEGFGPGTSDTS